MCREHLVDPLELEEITRIQQALQLVDLNGPPPDSLDPELLELADLMETRPDLVVVIDFEFVTALGIMRYPTMFGAINGSRATLVDWCLDRDQDMEEQWRDLAAQIEAVLTESHVVLDWSTGRLDWKLMISHCLQYGKMKPDELPSSKTPLNALQQWRRVTPDCKHHLAMLFHTCFPGHQGFGRAHEALPDARMTLELIMYLFVLVRKYPQCLCN